MSSPINERPIVVAGVSTRVLEVDGDGPPVLLLHGFTDSADSWRPLLQEFASRGRRAVAVDLPGSGRADRLARPALPHHDAFVDGFVRAYAERGDGVVVGNSLGGLLALRAAARSEVPLGAVVGIGPAGLAYGWRLRYLTTVLRCLDPMLQFVDRAPVPAALIRRGAARFYARGLAAGRAEAGLALRYAEHVHGMRDVGRLRSDLLALSRESDHDPLRTDRIRLPVLLIWGREDKLADPNSAPSFLATVPTATLETLDNCGHCPQLEEPGRIADLILSTPCNQPTPKADS
ncbi:alpha/beta fold hydrolase [Rhodococcus koreensis]|uniref:alpha/beta fold hydrolase n=1 Tax=Rhodococcus koreensis TaxID=99653 RepID=UPI00366C80F8